jgi:hypothetical protein
MPMRLLLSGFLLIVAGLSIADRTPNLPLAVTGITVGALLALTVVLDSAGLTRWR